jgi:hypothetical protein
MPSFVLRENVDELAYDFSPYSGNGVVPEPSATQIQNFRVVLSSLVEDMAPAGADTDDPTELLRRVTEYLARDTSEIQDKLLHALADVCSDQPAFDELEALPYRAQQAFSGWITGTFLVPKLPITATSS